MNNIRLCLAVAAAAIAVVQPVLAAPHKTHHAAAAADASSSKAPGTETLGTAGTWSAFASHDKTGQVCYLAGHPQKSAGTPAAGSDRQQPMAMVTHRPAENIANVVSFVEGYRLKDGSDVTLEVGDRKFELFTKDDSAWAATSELDRTIVATLAKGGSATVKGVPEKGRPTTDTYSLSGFAKALAMIDKACGVKREGGAAASASLPPASSHSHKKKHKKLKTPG